MKIAHYLSSCGIASRRKSQELVASGAVTVNGQVITDVAVRVAADAQVMFEGTVVSFVKPVLYKWYKPAGVLVTHEKSDRTNIFDILPKNLGHLLYIGRLDYWSEGLLLLTNSNVLCSQLMHSSLPRAYVVYISDNWTSDMTDFVSQPFVVEGIYYQAWKVIRVEHKMVEIELIEGKNREIRHVCQWFGLFIKRLIRVRFGAWGLDKKV